MRPLQPRPRWRRDGSGGRRSTRRPSSAPGPAHWPAPPARAATATFMPSVEMVRSSAASSSAQSASIRASSFSPPRTTAGDRRAWPCSKMMWACSKRTGGESGIVEHGVVKAQPALQTALPRIAHRAVHGAAQLQLRRELRAHVAGQFQNRRHRETVPVERHRPVRLRKIIGGAEVYRKRQGARCPRVAECSSSCCAIRSSRPLRSSGQPCPLPGIRSQRCTSLMSSRPVIPMLLQRTGQVHARSERAVDAGVLPAQQRGDFAQAGAVDVEIHVDASGIGDTSGPSGGRSPGPAPAGRCARDGPPSKSSNRHPTRARRRGRSRSGRRRFWYRRI